MSTLDDKARGAGNNVAGNVKQAVGNATGDEQLQAEGQAQETKGEVQTALGNAKEAIGDALKSVGDKIKGAGN